jgi:ABC-type proline/glycine betaine transport system permease subunit
MNTIVTFGALTIFMVVGFIMTVPDVPVFGFVVGLMAIGIVLPILIYPFTYTMWLALDLTVHPPDDAELARAAAACAETRRAT